MERKVSVCSVLWKFILILIVLFIVAFIVFALLLSAAMKSDQERIANTVNLTSHNGPLKVGELWKEEGLFSVRLNSITEIPSKQAEKDFNMRVDEGNRYYLVCFDYENIKFPGYYEENVLKENQLRMSVYTYGFDKEGNMVVGGWATKDLDPFYCADYASAINDNIFLLELKTDTLATIEIIFDIQTKNSLEVYRQNYLFSTES